MKRFLVIILVVLPATLLIATVSLGTHTTTTRAQVIGAIRGYLHYRAPEAGSINSIQQLVPASDDCAGLFFRLIGLGMSQVPLIADPRVIRHIMQGRQIAKLGELDIRVCFEIRQCQLREFPVRESENIHSGHFTDKRRFVQNPRIERFDLDNSQVST